MSYFLNLRTYFFRIMKHELIKGSFWLFLGGFLGSILSFIYNLFLARALTYSDYGTYTSLIAFETLLAIPATTLTTVIVRFAASYLSKNEIDRASLLFKNMLIIWCAISIGLVIAILSLSHLILAYLHITDIRLLIVVAAALGFSYFGVVIRGFLQSLTKFLYLGFINFLSVFSKLAIGGLMVISGFGVFGALTGVLSIPVVFIIFGLIPLLFLLTTDYKNKSGKLELKEMAYFGIPVSIGLISLSSFFNTDVILVKHFYPATLAGYYSGLSIVGKVIFYFTGAIPAVMFPLLVRRHTKGESFKRLFYLALVLVTIPSIAITLFYFIFPDLTINLFLGGRDYLRVAPYLGIFGIFLTLLNITSVAVNFFLSLKITRISFLVFAFAFVQFILIYLFHDNFYEVIFSSIISILILLFSLFIYYFKKFGI